MANASTQWVSEEGVLPTCIAVTAPHERRLLLDSFSNVQWIFFDVGYTLFDETPAWQNQFEAVSRALKSSGRDVPVDDVWAAYRELCQQFEPFQWLGVVKKFAQNESEVQELAALSKGWRHNLEKTYDGSSELLKSLHGRYKLGVIANQSVGTASRLRERGLLEHIDLVIGSAEAGVRKPDPKIFQMALMKAGCDASAAAMVGDRIDNDIAPAKALGFKTVQVRQGGSALQIARSDIETADAIVDSIIDIGPLFLD